MNSVFENPYVSGEKSILTKLIEKHSVKMAVTQHSKPVSCTSKQGHDWRATNPDPENGCEDLECIICGHVETIFF